MTTEPTERNQRRIVEGTVTSDKMAKTITVSVTRTFKHAKYGKYLRKRKKYHAHDEQGEAKVGDLVVIAACRPISRHKCWRLEKVLVRASEAGLIAIPGEEIPGQPLRAEGGKP